MSFCSFFGKEVYKDHFKPGMYVCSQCGHPLFSSRSKFSHSSPWPAFTETIREDSVTKMMESLTAYKIRKPARLLQEKEFDRMTMTGADYYPKVLCGKCGNGLGHEFLNDGPEDGLSRFWIFSHSLKFVPKDKANRQ